MKTRLLFVLALTGLCCQPLHAASYYTKYAKKAFTGAATVGYWGALYYDLIKEYKFDCRLTQRLENRYSSYAEQVTADSSLIAMIHREAIKKGLDPKKIYIHEGNSISVSPTAATVRSLFTKDEYHLFLGLVSRPELATDTPNEPSLPYCAATWKVPLIQHELNHIKHKDHALEWGTACALPFAAHLIIAHTFRLPFKVLGSAYGFRPTLLPRATEKLLLLPATLTAKDYLTKNTWAQTVQPWLSRYQEKQADLNIDDDPEIITGFIDWLQYTYASNIKELGKEAVDAYYQNASHPHPLERIAYMKEKLRKVLEKQKEASQ